MLEYTYYKYKFPQVFEYFCGMATKYVCTFQFSYIECNDGVRCGVMFVSDTTCKTRYFSFLYRSVNHSRVNPKYKEA